MAARAAHWVNDSRSAAFLCGLYYPLPGDFSQFAVAVEFINLTLVAWQCANYGFTASSQRCHGGAQARSVAHALTPGASLRGLIVLGSYGLTGQFISGRGAPLWNRVTSWAIQSGWLGKFERGVARNRALLRWSVDSGSLVRDPARLDAAMREEIAREGASPHAFEAFEQWQRSEVLPEGLRSNYVPRLHEIRVPTLIVHGESDQGVPVEAARAAAAEIPGAELVVVPGGRHWVQRDAPGVVDAAVLGFLARLA